MAQVEHSIKSALDKIANAMYYSDFEVTDDKRIVIKEKMPYTIVSNIRNNIKDVDVVESAQNPLAHLSVKMDEGITTQRREGVLMPDRPKTQYEQRWDAMSDLQKMQLQGLLEHYSEEYSNNYGTENWLINRK